MIDTTQSVPDIFTAKPTIVVTQELIAARLATADAKRYWDEACKRRDDIAAARWGGKGRAKDRAMADLPAANRLCDETQQRWEQAARREYALTQSLIFWD